MTPSIRRTVGTGQVRVARNCWVDRDAADELSAVCAAVLASSAPDSVISSGTAARIHDLWLPQLPPTIHVATATPGLPGRAMTRTRRPEIVAHRMRLDAADITIVDGVTVMTMARTWRDLAGVLSLPDLVAAGDSVLRAGATVEELADVVERTKNGRFARRAKTVLPLLDARSRSRPESHLRVAVSGADMPRFEVNVSIYRDSGGWLAEPDLSLAEARLALEYQGEDHAKVRRMRRDITRGRDVRAEGWLFLYYGPAEVFGRPWTIEPEVRAELVDRAPHLLRPRRRRPNPPMRVAS